MLTKLKYLSMVAVLVFCLSQSASAELTDLGLVNSTNGFPFWYMDENGVGLELCLAAGGNCVFDPPIANNIFSQVIGFGENAFYWSAEADLIGSGANGSLNLALVAGFSGSTTEPIPANGEQITFFLIVVGPITGLTPGGIYTVTHPYGVLTNLIADSSGTIPAQRQDIGCAAAPCDFTPVLKTGMGPFLRWDPTILPAAPSGFIGDPTVTHKVIGSPFHTNLFRIDGPNAGGSGVNTKQTDLFKVQGKLFTGTSTLPIPLIVNRAVYTRPLPPQIEVLATSSRLASLNVSWPGFSPGATMTTDGNGNFFANISNPVSFPNSVIVTAIESGKPIKIVASDLVDIVTITSAEFHPVTKALTIQAHSSDQVAPPTLTAVGFGDLAAIPGDLPNQKLVVSGLTVPPAEVTVISSAGGMTTAPVSVIARPLAKNDSALTSRTNSVMIDVIANDIAFPVGSGTLDPATVTIVTPPTKALGPPSVDPATGIITYTPDPSKFTKPIQTDTFQYKVADSFGQESNAATVTVTVAASETLTVTKAVFTTSTKRWQISGKSTVKSGNRITLYVGTGTLGSKIVENDTNSVPVNTFGGWSYSKPNSSVDPGGATTITAVSSFGTVVTFPLTIN
ncbi:MAG: Ig-like domain-containing protein [Thermodesulfobacteriota bacterium]